MSTPEGMLLLRTLMDGATAMATLACALFFLRFWKQSRDRLFAFFSLAFAVLAVNRTVFALMVEGSEQHGVVFLVRLVAFLLILFGIWDKNRRP